MKKRGKGQRPEAPAIAQGVTVKEAIRLLDPETTAEAIADIEYYAGFSGKTAAVQAITDACEIACYAMREKLERENPAPLTPEEIRALRGQPVYCPEVGAWGIVTMDKIGAWKDKPFFYGYWLEKEDAPTGVEIDYNIEERGLTLYRYKPEKKGGRDDAKD